MTTAEQVLERLATEHAAALGPILKTEADALVVDGRAARQRPSGLVAALEALDAALDGARLTRVDLYDQDLGDDDVQRLARCGWAAHVVELDLGGNRIGPDALDAVRDRFSTLRALNVSYTPVGGALARLGGLAELERLLASYVGLDAGGVRALASAELPALTWLDLSGAGQHLSLQGYTRRVRDYGRPDRLPLEATRALMEGLGAQLETLVLETLRLDRAACEALATPRLRTLVLNDTDLGGCDATLLGGSWPALRWLERSGGFAADTLGDAPVLEALEVLRVPGAEAMTDAEAVRVVRRAPALVELEVSGSGAGAGLVEAVAASAAPLRRVGLGGMDLSDEEVAPLWRARWLTRARRLGLMHNRLSDASIEAILAADVGDARLDLADNAFTKQGFARLQERFGAQVTGGERQDPAKVGGGELRLVPAPKPPAARFVKMPKALASLGLKVEACPGDPGWFAGRTDDGVAVLVTARGKRIDPEPAIPVEAAMMAAPQWTVCKQVGLAAVVAPGAGIHVVALDTGETQRLGDARGRAHGVAFVPDGLLVLHGDGFEPLVVELFEKRDGGWALGASLDGLDAGHEGFVLDDSGRLAAIGKAGRGFSTGPVDVVSIHDGALVHRGSLTEGRYRLVAGEGGPYLKGGGQHWVLEGL